MTSNIKIENLFKELLIEIKQSFSQNEIQEVTEYLDHNEYGLALDVVVAIIVEENKEFSTAVSQLIRKLMEEMSLEVSQDSSVYEFYLKLNLL